MKGMTSALVNCILYAEVSGGVSWSEIMDAHGRLAILRDAPLEDDLHEWANTLGSSSGFPLIGIGKSTANYPALFWNGVRLTRSDLGLLEALILVGLATRRESSTASDLLSAVRAGCAVNAELELVLAGSDRVGLPTTFAIAAAACAGVMSRTPSTGIETIIDLAGGLMVVAGQANGQKDLDGLLLGHSMAVGWLTPQVATAGIVPMPDGVEHTLEVYSSNLSVAVAPTVAADALPTSSEVAPGDVQLTDLVSALV